MSVDTTEQARRWRLILGSKGDLLPPAQASDKQVSVSLSEQDQQRDELLNYLYHRESKHLGYRYDDELWLKQNKPAGGSEDSNIRPADWLHRVRKVFPRSTVEVLQKHAVERYDMKALLTDKRVLKQTTPSMSLVQTLLSFRSHLTPEVMAEVRGIIRVVCEQLEARLAQRILSRFACQRVRHQHGGRKLAANLDWSTSLRRNLKHYQPESDELVLERLYFFTRNQHKIPWRFIVLVDQSGSMVDSVIHSAVMASVFFQVKAIKTHLVLFDTSVVDLSSEIQNPVETLLSVQLGGGTDIANAVNYAGQLIDQPNRTLVVLVSDFAEGGDVSTLYSEVQRLKESGVRMLGLAALDEKAMPWYDERIARGLVQHGMPISAMTPDHLAEWVADKIRE